MNYPIVESRNRLENPEYVFLAEATDGKQKGLKDVLYDVGSHYPKPASRRATTGRHRTYLRLKIVSLGFSNNPTVLHRGVDCLARPYYRIAGVWYWTSKSLDVSFRCRLDYMDNKVQELEILNPAPDVHGNRKTALHKYSTSYNSDHFGGIDAWAKTPHTGYARIQYNENICY
jgi:hypothetical protein